MTTIRKDAPIFTVMNTFTVSPENMQQFLDLMVEFNEKVVSHKPGYLSTNLHRSVDDTHVVNYTQWRSREDFQRTFMHSPPDADIVAYFQRLRPIAEPHPRFYEVHYSHSLE